MCRCHAHCIALNFDPPGPLSGRQISTYQQVQILVQFTIHFFHWCHPHKDVAQSWCWTPHVDTLTIVFRMFSAFSSYFLPCLDDSIFCEGGRKSRCCLPSQPNPDLLLIMPYPANSQKSDCTVHLPVFASLSRVEKRTQLWCHGWRIH